MDVKNFTRYIESKKNYIVLILSNLYEETFKKNIIGLVQLLQQSMFLLHLYNLNRLKHLTDVCLTVFCIKMIITALSSHIDAD